MLSTMRHFLPLGLVATAFAAGPPSNPTVAINNGTVVGVYSQGYNQDYFLGIPYAQPPVGSLRFRNPQSINTTWSQPQNATAYGPLCVGNGNVATYTGPLSEDCLTLSVLRPTANSLTPSKNLPVLLWIHGGGYNHGGEADPRYNLTFIIQNSVQMGKPMIGVSIQYRLGAWGFLASDEVTGSGQTNLGLKDQRLALQWVQENIEAFGGDPTRVTIWGQSAGASSVGLHLVAYGGRNDSLFRAAIMESGNPVTYQSLLGNDHYEPIYNNMTLSLGCSSAIDTLDCLRSVPYAAMNSYITSYAASSFFPVVDGDFIRQYPSKQLAAGQFLHVPILSGANTDEGTNFAPKPVNNESQFISYLEAGTVIGAPLAPTFVSQILAAYPDDPCQGIPADEGCNVLPLPWGAEYRRAAAYYGDAVFIAARRLTCATWAAAGVPAYCYRFNALPNGDAATTGVTHFAENALVMYDAAGVGYVTDPFANRNQSFFDLAKLMSYSWLSFAHDLDPNAFTQRQAGVPAWPAYDVGNPEDFVFDANVTSYVESDTFRAAGISVVNSLAVALMR